MIKSSLGALSMKDLSGGNNRLRQMVGLIELFKGDSRKLEQDWFNEAVGVLIVLVVGLNENCVKIKWKI